MNHFQLSPHKTDESKSGSSQGSLHSFTSSSFVIFTKKFKHCFMFFLKLLNEWKMLKVLFCLIPLLLLIQILLSSFIRTKPDPINLGEMPLIEEIGQSIWNRKSPIDDELNIKSLLFGSSQKLTDGKTGRRINADENALPLCPPQPPNLLGKLDIKINSIPPTFEEIAKHNPKLKKGGIYRPPECLSRAKVAFIIPHRARELHLRALLWHLLPILQRQQIEFKIFVAHQAFFGEFNKAKLMNVAFLHAMREDSFECFVFHDVDLLAEDDRLLYWCHDTPRHLSVSIDKYGYTKNIMALFGGVTMLSRHQFLDINGFSNKYWGWGGEDDDIGYRLLGKGYTIRRPPFHLGRYKMSFHHRDKGNKINPMRYEVLKQSIERAEEDGLSNVKFAVHSVTETPLFTNVTINVGAAKIKCLSKSTCQMVNWLCDHFGVTCNLLKLHYLDNETFS